MQNLNSLFASNKDTETFTKEIAFRPNASGQAIFTNDFLQRISEASGKMRVYTSYGIKTNIRKTVTNVNNTNRIIICVSAPVISGDYNYKDFSLENYLMPDIYSGIITVENGSGKRIIHKSFRVENVEQFPLVILDTVVLNNNNNIIVKIPSLEPSYSEKSYHRFMRFANALHDYYNASEYFDRIESLIHKLENSKIESMIIDEFNLCEIESVLGDVNQKDFFNFLIIKQKDVNSVFSKYEYYNEKITSLRAFYNQSISDIDKLFYVAGVENYLRGNRKAAKDNFKKAVNFNKFNVPALIELGKIHIDENKSDSALFVAKHILKDIYPSGEWLNMAINYSSIIYDSVCNRINFFIAENRYPDALSELMKLQEFCSDIYPFHCDDRVAQMQKRARLGVYNSYLSVAQRAYDINNLSFSEMYSQSAIEYQKEHTDLIGEYKLAEAMLQKIFVQYLVIAREQRKEGLWDRSIYYFDNAKRLCNAYSFLNCPPNLDSDIAELHLQKERQVKLALSKPKIISNATVVHTPEIKTEYKGRILETLSHGHLMAWAGEIIEAKISLEDAINESEIFELYSDTLVFSRIQSLKQRIFQKECEINNNLISDRFYKIQLLIKYAEYVSAMDSLTKLNRFVDNLDDCNIYLGDSLLMLQSYIPAAEYQTLLRSAKRLLNSDVQHKHESFFQRYMRAQNLWESKNLMGLGVEHLQLVDYISRSSQIDFIYSGITYFSDNSKPDDALKLLLVIKNKGISSKNTKDIQEYAGKKAAEFYKNKYPKENHSNLANKITDNDSWFKYFVSAFKKSWR
ncbi:MAG: hypothetical protein KGZ97_08195 [Bacteroidetes bacterium]|nr:hypothetical protein [Bacteroidota bacterium]